MDKRRIEMLWAKASQHRWGKGMEQGVDLSVIRRHYCVLIKRGAMARAGALMAIGAGALWPPARVRDTIKGKEDMDVTCKFCGGGLQDEEHMCWKCPVINAKRKASIRRTNGKYFDHQTGEIGVGTRCYFMRGLMPAAWTTPGTPPEYFREELGSSNEDKNSLAGYRGHKIQIYTDGSGGENTSDPRLQRCGWS